MKDTHWTFIGILLIFSIVLLAAVFEEEIILQDNNFTLVSSSPDHATIVESLDGTDYGGLSQISSGNASISFRMNIVGAEFMGSTDYGDVTRLGPVGNTNSPVKVAYIIGVHPMEWQSHEAILASILSRKDSLNYCYYIYQVRVTNDTTDYNKGRINGQELARKFVVPDIQSRNFKMVVDVHSNRGVYQEKWFISVPVNDKPSLTFAHQIINQTSWLKFYVPPLDNGPTSGPYVCIPLIKSGTPTMVYETYMYEPMDASMRQASDFVRIVDGLDF